MLWILLGSFNHPCPKSGWYRSNSEHAVLVLPQGFLGLVTAAICWDCWLSCKSRSMEREQCCASAVGWIIFLAFFFPIHIALKGNDTLQKAAGGKQGSSWYLGLSFIPHCSMSMHCHQMLILFFKPGGPCIVTVMGVWSAARCSSCAVSLWHCGQVVLSTMAPGQVDVPSRCPPHSSGFCYCLCLQFSNMWSVPNNRELEMVLC
jgi:hypothetical protein